MENIITKVDIVKDDVADRFIMHTEMPQKERIGSGYCITNTERKLAFAWDINVANLIKKTLDENLTPEQMQMKSLDAITQELSDTETLASVIKERDTLKKQLAEANERISNYQWELNPETHG